MYEQTVKKLFDFIEASPSQFHAIENQKQRLLAEGYVQLFESKAFVNSVPLSVCISLIGKGQLFIKFTRKRTELSVLCSSYISLYVQRVHSSTAVY